MPFIKLKKHWRFYVIGLLLVANSLTWYAIYREKRNGILTVAFLDVGQGDAIYIESPSGNQMLIDGGPKDRLPLYARRYGTQLRLRQKNMLLSPVLGALSSVMPFYDRSIDVVALSHPHADHVGGFTEILKRYRVATVMTSGTKENTESFGSFEKKISDENIETLFGRKTTRIYLDEDVVLSVLLPVTDVSNSKPHDGMLVLRLEYASTSILFTGDMEKNLEGYLLDIDRLSLESDILKVGHHGSRTSTSDAFLGYVKPKVAIISVGKKNSYKHPHQEVIERLGRFNIPVYRTDQDGTIVIRSDGKTINVITNNKKTTLSAE